MIGSRGDDLEIVLSDHADWDLFDETATRLHAHFGGEWVEQLDGLDQRYWDLRVGESTVTLHLESSLGISLFPARDSADPEGSAALLERIRAYLGARA